MSKYLYATYRIIWEHASEKDIIDELKIINRDFLKRIKLFSWKKALLNKDQNEKLSILQAIPSFMIDHLLPVMSMNFLEKNIQFMNGLHFPMEIALRVNTLHSKLDENELITQVKEYFKKKQISFRNDDDLPFLFWIARSQKNKIIRSSYHQEGKLIFQDKASAAVIQTLSPGIKEKICDMCAAPGIKTSLIAQYQKNQGHIVAGEFLSDRVKTMKNLMKNFNTINLHIINTDSIVFPIRYQNYFDKILLDAPCTGSGALLTSPELKWRQNSKFLHQNMLLQEKLLKSAIALLKPSGTLVYSTCSLYQEEGEYQISKFIDRFEPMNLPEWIDKSYKIDSKFISGTGRLFPANHHTEGFFIAKFKKK